MDPIVIRLMSGKRIDLLDLKPQDIHLAEICHRLSQQCRYAGATPVFYSVAEHCLNLDKYFDSRDPIRPRADDTPELHAAALLHDAAEAYLGDLIAPVKHSWIGLGYRRLEDRVLHAVVKALTGWGWLPFSSIRPAHNALMEAEDSMFNGTHRAEHYADLISGDSMPNIAGELYDRLVRLGVRKHG
jgi:hypothetical protein